MKACITKFGNMYLIKIRETAADCADESAVAVTKKIEKSVALYNYCLDKPVKQG